MPANAKGRQAKRQARLSNRELDQVMAAMHVEWERRAKQAERDASPEALSYKRTAHCLHELLEISRGQRGASFWLSQTRLDPEPTSASTRKTRRRRPTVQKQQQPASVSRSLQKRRCKPNRKVKPKRLRKASGFRLPNFLRPSRRHDRDMLHQLQASTLSRVAGG